jgi:hypothetical protein
MTGRDLNRLLLTTRLLTPEGLGRLCDASPCFVALIRRLTPIAAGLLDEGNGRIESIATGPIYDARHASELFLERCLRIDYLTTLPRSVFRGLGVTRQRRNWTWRTGCTNWRPSGTGWQRTCVLVARIARPVGYLLAAGCKAAPPTP